MKKVYDYEYFSMLREMKEALEGLTMIVEVNNQSRMTTIPFIKLCYAVLQLEPKSSADRMIQQFLKDSGDTVLFQNYESFKKFIKGLYDSYTNEEKWSPKNLLSPEFREAISQVLTYQHTNEEIDEYNNAYDKAYTSRDNAWNNGVLAAWLVKN